MREPIPRAEREASPSRAKISKDAVRMDSRVKVTGFGMKAPPRGKYKITDVTLQVLSYNQRRWMSRRMFVIVRILLPIDL